MFLRRNPEVTKKIYLTFGCDGLSFWKALRALKNAGTSVLDSQQIYYDHISPHQGLNGKTPERPAGLGFGREQVGIAHQEAKGKRKTLELPTGIRELTPSLSYQNRVALGWT
jgi:hypothetical protein